MSVRRDKVEDTPFVQRLRSLMGGKTMPLPARIGGGFCLQAACAAAVSAATFVQVLCCRLTASPPCLLRAMPGKRRAVGATA